MKFHNFGAAIAAMAVGLVAAAHQAQEVQGADGMEALFPNRRHRGKGQQNKRGKGLRSRPKKRPNRLHISKRVRRSHRRAA